MHDYKLLSFFMKKRRLFIRSLLKIFRPKHYKWLSDYWPWVSISPEENFHHEIYSLFRKKITTSSPVSEICTCSRVFSIVGSGQSINNIDFHSIRSDVNLILLNGAIDLIYTKNLEPLCCVIIDSTFIESRFYLVQNLPEGTKLVTTIGCLRAMYERDKKIISKLQIFITQNIINPMYHEHLHGDKRSYFLQQGVSNDLDIGCIDGGSVMCIAIQMVFQLKAKEIYLLGFDIGNSEQPRFNESIENRLRSGLLNDYEGKILPFMHKVKSYCVKNKIDIYNCSAVSKLPYDLISFKDVESIYFKR